MKRSIILFGILFIVNNTFSQPVRQPNGGGDYRDLVKVKDELTPEQRTSIIQMLQTNEARLRSEGRLQRPENTNLIAFQWPLKQALNNNDNGYYGISNYVDENPAFPNQVRDYNCGNRSYDQSSGYNHAGTDIFTWPFPWQKMQRDAVQIIAAAPGTIIAKSDGNFDQNCAFCSGACNCNAVYVMHADGSVAWYGHMKTNSLTAKAVGQTVTTGEYLGVVGSSGNSTGPHLHFEVYTNSSYTQLVDPWGGACNSLNGLTSWWANQEPYYVSTINKIMTHGVAPASGSCPNAEVPNEKINFANGETIYLGSYYRDQLSGQQAQHRIYRPDSTVFASWTQNFTIYYSASWWWYSQVLPSPAPAGVWRYEVTYNGTQKTTAFFSVNAAPVIVCPDSYNVLTSNLTGSAMYQWQVNTGSGFANVSNGTYYTGTNTRFLQLKNAPSSYYGYEYRCEVDGSSYSNTLSLKFTSYWLGSQSSAWEDPRNWSCGNIPDAGTDVVILMGANTPVVSSNAICRSLTATPGTTVTVGTGWGLTVVK